MSAKCRIVSLVYVGFCVLVVALVIQMSEANDQNDKFIEKKNQTVLNNYATSSPVWAVHRRLGSRLPPGILVKPPLPFNTSHKLYNGDLKYVAFIGKELLTTKKKSSNCSTPVDFFYGEAERGEFPHQALLGYAKVSNSSEIEFVCGGSLISEWYVLTAAHCNSLRLKIVRLGEYNLDDESDGQQDYAKDIFIKHPNFTWGYSYHDIALVKVTKKIQFNERVRAASLWKSSPFNISSVVATGFGRTSNDNKLMSPKLIKVGLNILNNTQCTRKYGYDRKLDKGMIPEQLCVGIRGGGKDTCNGDSGGPIQVALDFETCSYYVVGITSFGSPRCGVGDSEAVYTQVASYLDWIEPIVWPAVH